MLVVSFAYFSCVTAGQNKLSELHITKYGLKSRLSTQAYEFPTLIQLSVGHYGLELDNVL